MGDGTAVEYIVKGFTMNDDLLKEAGGGNYFEELLARIRDIRSSEKVFLAKDFGYLRDQYRRRSEVRNIRPVFSNRAKQNALGGTRTHRRRDCFRAD